MNLHDELAFTRKPAPRVPYYQARLAELVSQGLAQLRVPAPKPIHQPRAHRAAAKLSWIFSTRLSAMQDILVYYTAAGSRLSFRRSNPKPGLNGKVLVPRLPVDAEFIGRYTFPHSRILFLRDLIATIGGAP